jgi:hypothetical protein
MTDQSGQTWTRDRSREVEEYLAEVREALASLPPSERDDLVEDLASHLTEVAAEDPAPLRERLGPPARYAAELHAAAAPPSAPARTVRWAEWWEGTRTRLDRLDQRVGPLLGYQRASEFGRLLLPAWWVLRGYLAAMVVVAVLDRQGGQGLLPRLGGSTVAGLLILAVFVAGSVWLAQRTADLDQWQRRGVYLASGFLVLFGVIGFFDVDHGQRSGFGEVTRFVSENPYEDVQDVYVVGPDGRLLTGVTLLDQSGQPLDIGWVLCEEPDRHWEDNPVVTYPRCPQDAPPWLPIPEATATSTPVPSPEPSRSPVPTPTPGGTPVPSPTTTPR